MKVNFHATGFSKIVACELAHIQTRVWCISPISIIFARFMKISWFTTFKFTFGFFGTLIILTYLKFTDVRIASPGNILEYTESSGYFNKTKSGENFQITRGFYDYTNKLHRISFKIKETDYLTAKTEFGLNRKECVEYVKSEMIKLLDKEKARLKLDFTLSFELSPENELSWRYKYSYGTNVELKQIKSLIKLIEDKYYKEKELYYRRCGVYAKNDILCLDYQWIVDHSRDRVNDVLLNLTNKMTNEIDEKTVFLPVLLSFCQEIEYEKIPEEIDNKTVLGLLPPPQVLVENRGDCDCKALLFATLWAMYKGNNEKVALIEIPDHLFVAVPGIKNFSTDLAFELDGINYVCLEPVGPGKIPAGTVHQLSQLHFKSGNYKMYFVSVT